MNPTQKPSGKDPQELEPERPGQTVGQRFSLQSPIASIQGASYFTALDTQTGSPVLLKTVPLTLLSTAVQMRVDYETSLLVGKERDHLAGRIASGRDALDYYVASELIEGETLQQRLKCGPLGLEEAIAVARGCLLGLEGLHDSRVLHRNLRPENLLIGRTDKQDAVVLTDYGLSLSVDPDMPLKLQPLDVARYSSPEQAGSIDHSVTASSDLYSLGAILYYCLAGKPPYDGDTVGTLLFKHLTEPVPAFSTRSTNIPIVLEDFVQRLLRKDPRDRYQTAAAALADLNIISRAIEEGDPQENIVLGSHDRRVTLTDPAFVGRVQQMRAFKKSLADAMRGETIVLSVAGESGAGKSRLLSEMLRSASKEGVRVYRGVGASDVSSTPYRLLGGIVEGLVGELAGNPRMKEQLISLLGEHLPIVVSALPDLKPVLGDKAEWTAASETGEARTIEALIAFIDALGRMEKTALVLLDDCQWADELTTKLLRRMAAPDRLRGQDDVSLMIVVAYRSEEVDDDHPLRRLEVASSLKLPPMLDDEIRQVAESMAGELPEVALQTVTSLANGSPFMASAVLYGLVECQALIPRAAGWEADEAALSNAGSSTQAGTFLARRLRLMQPRVLHLLSIGAVLGKQFDLHTAHQLSGLEPHEVIEAVEDAKGRQLIWVRPNGAECVFFHDKIRATLLQEMAPDDRRREHLAAAQYLLEHSSSKVADIAYHFDEGGDPVSAFPLAAEAAEQARARYASEIAEQQYQIALRGASTESERLQIKEGMGDVLMFRGSYEEAGKWFEGAEQYARTSFPQARLRSKLGELSFKRGDMANAISHFETALRMQGTFVPRRSFVLLAVTLWEVLVQLVHTALPMLVLHRVQRRPNESERLTMRLLSYLAHGCWYSRKQTLMLWSHLRNINMGEKHLPSPELAQAYSEHGPAMTVVGYFSRGIRYAERAIKLREELGDHWGRGQSLVFLGITLFAASRYSECISKCREAIRVLERMGDYWQIHMARYQIAASMYYLGDVSEAVEEAKTNRRSGLETGDEQASGIILDVWARASNGKIPREIIEVETGRARTDAQGACQVSLAEGVCLLADGDCEQSVEVLEDAIAIAAKAGVKNAYTLPPYVWAATAFRNMAERDDSATPLRRQRLLDRAEDFVRTSIFSSVLCKNDLPHAYRELALILCLQGKLGKARKAFQKGLKWADRLGQRLQRAHTLVEFARVGREAGWSDAEAFEQERKVLLAEFQYLPDSVDSGPEQPELSLSLVDRFDTLIDTGREIASTLIPDAIYAHSRNAALHLLRGEACQVVPVRSGAQIEWESCFPNGVHPSTRLRGEYAVQTGRAVADDPALAETLDLDGHAAGAAAPSLLCVPVQVRGRVEAMLYVSHSCVQGLFGPDELRMAEFVATLTGAALENAEGFAELNELNLTLEKRVAERTAAAESRASELAVSNAELERTANELREAQVELESAKQAADQASEAKSRFLATMSHEIRTPMNGVLGMTELVLNTPLDDQQRSYLTTVKQSGNALLALLNDVLDLSKIEAGRMELENIPFDPHDTVAGAARLLAVTAFGKGIELACRVDSRTPGRLSGDPNRLRQVLVNLISNAVKFTEEGHVLVDVSVDSDEDGIATLHCVVKDTGVGIQSSKLNSIFEAFRQQDNSITRRFGGTGLGLSISLHLTKLMGGRMWVESEVGVGSEFHALMKFESPAVSKPELESGEELHEQKVLLASSSELTDAVYGTLLRESGIDLQTELLSTAEKPGKQCLWPEQHDRTLVYDILAEQLSDLSQVREDLKFAKKEYPKVVVLLPLGNVEVAQLCRDLGVDKMIDKPIDGLELLQALRDLREDKASAIDGRGSEALSPDQGLRILVADDSPVNQEVAKGMLEILGHEVTTAENGLIACSEFASSSFDLILMDIEMPELDGFSATRRIRDMEESRNEAPTPVYALSAHVTDEFGKLCEEAAMDGRIAKPIQLDVLQDLLSRTTPRSRMSAVAD